MNQSAWIALIVVGVLVIIGIVLYLVLRRTSSSTAVLIPIFPPHGYNPNLNPELYPNGYNPNLPPGPGPIPTPLPPNGYNPNLPPGPGPHPNGYNPNLPPGPGPHPNGYNPNLTPSTSHALLPGVTTKDLSEAFASPL